VRIERVVGIAFYADRHDVLHARPHCDTVPSQILQLRIGPADEEPRCAVCCADLAED